MLITKGSTNVSINIRIVDSTDGTPETAVEHNTAGIDMWYRREGAAVSSITEVALAALTTAHTDGGIEHISHGWYRLDVPDAAFATGVDGVQIGGTVTGMVVHAPYVQLTDIDLFDGVRAGMTALPNAAADAAGGLPISDAGGLDLDAMNTNINDIEADTNELQGDWTNGGRLDLIIDELTTNVDAIETDTQDLQTQIGAAGAGLTAINLPNQTMDITGNITGNLSGSVGSVTGAVGSIAGVTFPTNFGDLTIEVTTGIVDSNVQKINDVTIIGDGSGTPYDV